MNAERRAGIRHPFDAPPAPGTATEVSPGILWMRLPLPMALDHVNVYALDDGDAGWTLIDTGIDTRRARDEWRALLDGPLAGRPVNRVVVTHYHPDHIGLAGWFRDQGAQILTTRTSWLLARMLVLDVQDVPPRETLDWWRSAGMPPDLLTGKSGQRPFNFADVVAPLSAGYTRISEGHVLRMGGRDWLVRIGHGHAPEHATFWAMDAPIVLGGDQFLPGISANIGVYVTEPDADPLADWLESCVHFTGLASDAHLVLPGHKLPYTGLPLRLSQMIAGHEAALDRLRRHLAAPDTAWGCFEAVFDKTIDPSAHMLALAEAIAHLNHLLKKGQIIRKRRADGAWMWQSADSPQM